MRQKHRLTSAEISEWRSIPTDNDEEDGATDAWIFWCRIARERAIDSASIIMLQGPGTFTALPLDHGKHWCHPSPLKCKMPPSHADYSVRPINIREDA